MKVLDPIVYATNLLESLSIFVPSNSEVEAARSSLVALASLSMACPLFPSLTSREKRRYYRVILGGIVSSVEQFGYIDALKDWNTLGSLFLNGFVREGSIISYDYDKELSRSPIHLAILRLVRLTSKDLGYFELAEWIYNWHVYLAKIPLSRPDLLIPAETAWIERQNEILDASNIPLSLVDGLRKTLAVLYDQPFDDDVIGKHGPGSTNLGIRDIDGKEANYFPCIQSQEITTRTDRYDVPGKKPLISKYMAVPKDIKSVRPITMESIAMQYAQQSLKRQLYKMTDDRTVYAGMFTTYSSQSRSQRLALLGSSLRPQGDARPITVDLSSASDYLSSELVALVFPSALVHKIMCARTWDVSVGKKVVEVGMYAGMGSATTFPVQTLVFTGIAVMATVSALFKKQFGGYDTWDVMLSEYLTRGSYLMHPRIYFDNICIYGDDIIVPEIATEQLYCLLERFGLRVNYSKSFTGSSAVREACGVYALAGRDITPARYRIPVHTGIIDSSVYESIREAANLAFRKNYLDLNRYFIRLVRSLRLFASGRLQKGGDILFEEYRGAADYIGWLTSRRCSDSGTRIINGEKRKIRYGMLGRTKTRRSLLSESYYYDEASFLLSFEDVLTEDHGIIPRGIRVSRRAAYRKSDMNGWAWSPV